MSHQQDVEDLQRWVWAAIRNGWNPSDTPCGRWAHDDNMQAQPLGWMIVMLPKSQYFSLISMQLVSPKEMYKQIAAAAPIHPVCAKAFAILTAQRLANPNVVFEYVDQ